MYLAPSFYTLVIQIWKACSLLALALFYLLGSKIDKWLILVLAYCLVDILGTGFNLSLVLGAVKDQLSTIVFVLFVIYAVRVNCFVTVARVLRLYYIVLFSTNLLTVLLYPDGLYVTDSVYYNPNHWLMGFVNIFILSYLFGLLLSLVVDYHDNDLKRLSYITLAMFAVALVTVLILWALTSVIVLIIFGCLLALRKKLQVLRFFNPWLVVGVLLACSILLFSGALTDLFSNLSSLFLMVGKNPTFTGRTGIWQFALSAANDHWLFGCGWQPSSTVIGNISATHAHNQLLQDFYTGGIVKLALLICMLFCVCKKLNSVRQSQIYACLLAGLAAFLIRWLTESTGMDVQIAYLSIVYFAPVWINENSPKSRMSPRFFHILPNRISVQKNGKAASAEVQTGKFDRPRKGQRKQGEMS